MRQALFVFQVFDAVFVIVESVLVGSSDSFQALDGVESIGRDSFQALDRVKSAGSDTFQRLDPVESIGGDLCQGTDVSAVLGALRGVRRDLSIVALRCFEQLVAGGVEGFQVDLEFVVSHAFACV